MKVEGGRRGREVELSKGGGRRRGGEVELGRERRGGSGEVVRGGGDPGEIEGKDHSIELLTSVIKLTPWNWKLFLRLVRLVFLVVM